MIRLFGLILIAAALAGLAQISDTPPLTCQREAFVLIVLGSYGVLVTLSGKWWWP